jgi:hypothetical protein
VIGVSLRLHLAALDRFRQERVMGTISKRLEWTLLVRGTSMPRLSKLLAYTLSTYMNAEGECYPAVARLARDLCACRRSIQLALRDLERRGLIETRLREGTSNIYRARIGGRSSVRTPAHQTTLTRALYVAPGATRGAPKPFNQPFTETVSKLVGDEDLDDDDGYEWWQEGQDEHEEEEVM